MNRMPARPATPLPEFRRAFPWQRAVRALPPLFTAAAFAHAWLQWGSAYASVMARTVQLEFVVIHAALFLGVLILVPVETASFRFLRWVAVALFAGFYLRIGYGVLEWQGVVSLAGIFVGTYGGFLMAPRDAGSGIDSRGRTAEEIGVRWGVAFLTYGLLTRVFELPKLVNEWTQLRESVALGACYFAVLALIEATPLYATIRGEKKPP